MKNYFKPCNIFQNYCEYNYLLSILKKNKIISCCQKIDLNYNGNNFSINTNELKRNYFNIYEIKEKSITLNFIKECVKNRQYLLLLFNTFFCKENQFYKKLQNYNMILIYGFKKNKIFCYMNLGFQGSKKISYDYEELIQFLVEFKQYKDLNFKPMIIERQNKKVKMKLDDIKKSLYSYYFSSNKETGYEIINSFITSFWSNTSKLNSNYDITSSFVMLIQFKKFQIIQIQYLKYDNCKDFIEKQIKILNLCKFEYIKWMYDKNILHLKEIYKQLQIIRNYEIDVMEELRR